jgi:hypothetical protein
MQQNKNREIQDYYIYCMTLTLSKFFTLRSLAVEALVEEFGEFSSFGEERIPMKIINY